LTPSWSKPTQRKGRFTKMIASRDSKSKPSLAFTAFLRKEPILLIGYGRGLNLGHNMHLDAQMPKIFARQRIHGSSCLGIF
jgi:hypothetical protein